MFPLTDFRFGISKPERAVPEVARTARGIAVQPFAFFAVFASPL
jgi:hypothetical protein